MRSVREVETPSISYHICQISPIHPISSPSPLLPPKPNLTLPVTGGAGTLALEAAHALLEHGLTGLALWDLNPDQALPSIKALHAKFPSVRIITEAVDVRDESQISSAVTSAAKLLGSIDILCCFAGVVACTPSLSMTADEWRRTHDINLTGSFLCAQAVARQMVSQKSGGSVVFTASISAHHTNFPQPQCAYNSSKTALLSLAKSLAAEWSAEGIRVNTLSPGYMDTILNEGEGLTRARDMWNKRNPMGRMGHPWELTGPLVLLCSNAGRYINGTDIIVDGGAMVF
jgi:NAD(P)-dependent dehydrogenase (short-subunit alcohol dehydrogenase family)